MRIYRPCFLLCPLILLLTYTARPVGADETTALEQLRVSSLQYNTPEKWEARRKQLREEFLRGARLWPVPDRPPVRAIRHSLREYQDYSVENVALETFPGFYCTGNLYRPLGQKDLTPIVLCPHGHFQPLGRFRENQQIRCAHMARMGATVFSYSMVGWQDSQQTTHDDPNVLALQTWNSIRAVDFLTGLSRVDSNRVAITGASGGGTQSFFLSLVDDRVTVSAPLVIVYPWNPPIGCLCESGLPVMQAAETNAIELAAASAPRPQLLISVGSDRTRSFPEVGFPFIKQKYALAGAAGAVKNVHLADEAHDFGPTKRREVYQFLAEHLKMQRDTFNAYGDRQPHELNLIPEDLTRITIETPQAMRVFDDDHPLPAHALHGSKAIAAGLEKYLDVLRNVPRERTSQASLHDAPRAEYEFQEAGPQDEALIFTPPGFEKVGTPRVASGTDIGTIKIVVRDSTTQTPTCCRINVIGSDGHYYEPADHELKRHSLTGIWPKMGWGNRPTKAPIRYLGRFFYSTGTSQVQVPAGTVRVEVWKGFEFTPTTYTTHIRPGRKRTVEISLGRPVSMPDEGYWSGDPHLHLARLEEIDDQRIFDLLEAEDIHFGTILAYNSPAGPYSGFMNRMAAPQLRGLGKRSVRSRGEYAILSGEEYRSSTFGHLNLFLLDELIMPGESYDANNWPTYGRIGQKAREAGGISFYAHGGYAKEIYADVAQGRVDGVELLQFGVYRGIGLVDWYHMLNTGFRVPANGASDYPACRKLGDCKTFVYSDAQPSIEQWLRGMAAGRSFISSGPLILLEVDGHRPGSRIDLQADGAQTVNARVRVRSEVAPVTNVQLIANGRVLHELEVPPSAGLGNWIELEREITLDQSAWIAARAFSLSRLGTPDAESHTNPVYIYHQGRAPYERSSLDAMVAAIDNQIDFHEQREFPERAQVIAYFERSRDILMKIREAEGASAEGHPSKIVSGDSQMIDVGARVHSDAELEAFLRPIPPKPIEEVLRSFETVDGFQMQLVAREPLVNDPIAAAFDERGNLYVCEMRDYPYQPQPGKQPIGSLRLLRDTNGDGEFDESHIFADQLLWTSGVVPYRGGVFVAAAPDIWYLRDTDGDHQADVRERVFTGFGTGNQQAMLNNLKWGLDHKIYGSTARNGGTIRPGNDPQAPGISVNGRDFRFDPVTREFETITGTVQFGNTFDDWGNRFLCSESQPLQHAVLPQHYLERNPYLIVPRAVHNVAPGPVPSFRISPLERWRQIRSSRRIAHGNRAPTAPGASHHVIDAAAGVTVYRGGAYPSEYYHNIFIGGAQNNLIHRRSLTPHGATFQSFRADQQTEFVRSSDNWFRPVNFVNAPDGTLYVLDMSREILETIHVPLDVTRFVDFKHGREHGRIYRLAPPHFQYPGTPRPDEETSLQLVALLESPHGWWRDTAHRLLFERQDSSTAGPLRKLLARSKMPQAQLHALWSLHGLGTLTDNDLLRGLKDSHAGVREHAMRLAESRLDANPKLLDQLLAQAEDVNPRIQLQLAFSLGASSDPRAARTLADMARKFASDHWIRTAVLSSASHLADRMFIELLDDRSFRAGSAGRELLEQLLTVVGARGETKDIRRVLDAIAVQSAREEDESQLPFVVALAEAMRGSGISFAVDIPRNPQTKQFLRRLFISAERVARDEQLDTRKRQSAIRLLGCAPSGSGYSTLEELIDIRQPEPVQMAAVTALAASPDPDVIAILLKGWRQKLPAVRQTITDALLARQDGTIALLRAVESGAVSKSSIELSRRPLLLKHKNTTVRSLASRLLGARNSGARAEVVEDYQPVLSLHGDAARGEKIFARECGICHRVGRTGHAVGPDLTSSAAHDPSALLVHILDPNRYVLPNYEQYLCVDSNGRMKTGMITAQTATSITLQREEKKSETILRGQIEELSASGKSLMPEGLEEKLSHQAMADLIAWLQSAQGEKPSDQLPLNIGTLPGLIEPDD